MHDEVGAILIPMLRLDAERPEEALWAEAAHWVRPTERGGLGCGGLLVFGGRADDLRTRLAALEREAGRRLLTCADYERGAGQQVRGMALLPHPFGIGASADPELARRAGRLTGLQARALGIRLVFAPLADLATAPDNPIIDVRAFGDDPHAVARLARSWSEGLHATGVAGCAKHYPGHGDVTVDSHLARPVLSQPLERLRSRELVPFGALVDADIETVMTAHLAAPALTGDPRRCVTVSRPAIELLRTELGFRGLVVSDALLMGGLLEDADETDGAIAALEAGCDVLLAPSDPAAVHARLATAVRERPGLRARLREARARGQALLARRPLAPLDDEERALLHTESARLPGEIAAAALTLVRGDTLPPVSSATRPLVVTASGDPDACYPALAAALTDPEPVARLLPVHPASPSARLEAVRAEAGRADRLWLVVGSSVRAWKEHVGLTPREHALCRALLAEHPDASVIALGSPRLLRGLGEGRGALACTGSDEPPSQRALGAWLRRGGPAPGTLPLTGAPWRALLATLGTAR